MVKVPIFRNLCSHIRFKEYINILHISKMYISIKYAEVFVTPKKRMKNKYFVVTTIFSECDKVPKLKAICFRHHTSHTHCVNKMTSVLYECVYLPESHNFE